jgi:hypothetical protein
MVSLSLSQPALRRGVEIETLFVAFGGAAEEAQQAERAPPAG